MQLKTFGNYEEALKLEEKVYNIYKTKFGEDNIETATIMNNLATTVK